MTQLHTKFYMLQNQEGRNPYTAIMLLFYILQKYFLQKSCIFLEDVFPLYDFWALTLVLLVSPPPYKFVCNCTMLLLLVTVKGIIATDFN